MNREIKFRAWDKERNEMELFNLGHKDGLLYQDGDWYVASGYDGEDNPIFEKDNVPSRYELMQYTGLKDKNGVEIYEGDIVEGRYFLIAMQVYWDTGQCGWELGNHDGSVTEHFLDLSRREDGNFQWIVLGNIYEHGHLLESTDENAKTESVAGVGSEERK